MVVTIVWMSVPWNRFAEQTRETSSTFRTPQDIEFG